MRVLTSTLFKLRQIGKVGDLTFEHARLGDLILQTEGGLGLFGF